MDVHFRTYTYDKGWASAKFMQNCFFSIVRHSVILILLENIWKQTKQTKHKNYQLKIVFLFKNAMKLSIQWLSVIDNVKLVLFYSLYMLLLKLTRVMAWELSEMPFFIELWLPVIT